MGGAEGGGATATRAQAIVRNVVTLAHGHDGVTATSWTPLLGTEVIPLGDLCLSGAQAQSWYRRVEYSVGDRVGTGAAAAGLMPP